MILAGGEDDIPSTSGRLAWGYVDLVFDAAREARPGY
jgi:hypothetical protein